MLDFTLDGKKFSVYIIYDALTGDAVWFKDITKKEYSKFIKQYIIGYYKNKLGFKYIRTMYFGGEENKKSKEYKKLSKQEHNESDGNNNNSSLFDEMMAKVNNANTDNDMRDNDMSDNDFSDSDINNDINDENEALFKEERKERRRDGKHMTNVTNNGTNDQCCTNDCCIL